VQRLASLMGAGAEQIVTAVKRDDRLAGLFATAVFWNKIDELLQSVSLPRFGTKTEYSVMAPSNTPHSRTSAGYSNSCFGGIYYEWATLDSKLSRRRRCTRSRFGPGCPARPCSRPRRPRRCRCSRRVAPAAHSQISGVSPRPSRVRNERKCIGICKCRQCKQLFAGAQERYEMSCGTNQGLNLAGCQNRYNW
jgi:hypothetical protein